MKITHKSHFKTKNRPIMRPERVKREFFKAWMMPTRLLKDLWRLIKWFGMLLLSPFYLVYYLYRVIFKKDSPVWDG